MLLRAVPGEGFEPRTPRGAGGIKQHTKRPSRDRVLVLTASDQDFRAHTVHEGIPISLVALSPLAKR